VIEFELIPFKGLAILIVGLAVTMGALFEGTPLDRFALLCFVSFAASLLLMCVGWLDMRSQITAAQRDIQRVAANYLVYWPQFNTVEEWKVFAQQEYGREEQPSYSPRSVIMWLFVSFVYAGLCAIGVTPYFWILFGAGAALIVGVSYSTLAQQNNQSINRLIYMQRLVSTPPRVYLCEDGI